MADAVQVDIPSITATLGKLDAAWLHKLTDVGRSHADPWVRYFALVEVARIEPAGVSDDLKALAHAQLGLVSAAAQLAAFQLQRGQG